MNAKAILGGLGALAIAVVGGVAGSVYSQFSTKSEYSVSVTSCSEKGPEKVVLENIDTGYRVQLPTGDIPVLLDRVTKIVNSGSKSIDGEDLHVNIDNTASARVHLVLIFFGNVLDDHRIDSSPGGLEHRIRLKRFNPDDTITVLTTSERTVGVSVNSKGAGYTIGSKVDRATTCGVFSNKSYGGKMAYSKVGEGCQLDPQTLNMKCERTQGYNIPKDFPPGRARIVFE